MHIFEKLPFLNFKDEDVEAVVSEEDLKAERVKFHRQRVRNGPAKFSHQTSGQIRREQVRALKRKTKKARRTQVRTYFASNREIATLRAHLQAAGILGYATEYRASPESIVFSISWIVSRFADDNLVNDDGQVLVTREVVLASLQAALNRLQHLLDEPQTLLSPAYVLPVAVAA